MSCSGCPYRLCQAVLENDCPYIVVPEFWQYSDIQDSLRVSCHKHTLWISFSNVVRYGSAKVYPQEKHLRQAFINMVNDGVTT